MRIWALSDLHLSLMADKPMSIFGDHWHNHHERMACEWDQRVADDDIMLTPGDFSWAAKPQQAVDDFAWLAERPGYKVLVKGNHDHWWPKSKTKLANLLPEKTFALKKNACRIGHVGIYGTRGGDFAPLSKYGDKRSQEDIDKVLVKERRELEASLIHLQQLESEQASKHTSLRICCFHYPPIPAGATSSVFTDIIKQADTAFCVYGHLHGDEVGAARVEGTIDSVRYFCASCDQIDFTPALIYDDQRAIHDSP